MGSSLSTASSTTSAKAMGTETTIVATVGAATTTATTETKVAPVPLTAQTQKEEGQKESKKSARKNKAAAKSGLNAMLKYDGRLEQLISPELMCYLQSVHEEKGEPVFLWGYHMNFSGDHVYGKEIRLLEENSIYTSDYDEIFENIDGAMPIWKGNDRLLIYEDENVEVRVAFANRKHAKHFLHCFACYCNGDSWPRNDKEWDETKNVNV